MDIDIKIHPDARENFNYLAKQMAERKPVLKFAGIIADSEETSGTHDCQTV
jgi:hypothetical protein